MGKQPASSKQSTAASKKAETSSAPKRHELVTLLQKQQDDRVSLTKTLKDKIVSPSVAAAAEPVKKALIFNDMKPEDRVRDPPFIVPLLASREMIPAGFKLDILSKGFSNFEEKKILTVTFSSFPSFLSG